MAEPSLAIKQAAVPVVLDSGAICVSLKRGAKALL